MAVTGSSTTNQAVSAVATPIAREGDLEEQFESLIGCFERSIDLDSSGSKASSLSSRELTSHDIAQTALRDVLTSNRFSPDLAEKREFHDLVVQYGEDRVLSAVREIGAQTAAKLSGTETIVHGYEMIRDVLEKGHVFTGVPVMVSEPSSPTGFSLQWRDSTEGSRLSPIRDSGIYCEKGQEETVLAATQKASYFATRDQMNEAFQHLKSNIPTGLKNDGCDMRCYWASFLLENLYGCESVKIKADHRDGMLLETKPPFAFEGVEWRMHTAPVVKLADGSEYVMDVALDRPMPLREWLDCLHSNQEQLSLSYSDRWDLECKSAAEAPQTIDMERLQKDLRGLYLFEMVDGNQSVNPDFSRRRSSTWMSWVDEVRGFSPVPQEQPVVSVIVDFIKQPDGRFSPKIEHLPMDSMFTTQDGLIFKGTGPRTKHQLYLRQNKLILN
ncbi:MAG: hypothetical protein JSR39_03040 [Verrucomicrobia bacterium]|nr:hypothetical protein [Verrucomicrobiota bacterium]